MKFKLKRENIIKNLIYNENTITTLEKEINDQTQLLENKIIYFNSLINTKEEKENALKQLNHIIQTQKSVF